MHKYKMSLKKDWLFLILVAVIAVSIILAMLYSVKIAINASIYEQSRDNSQKIKLFNENISLLCATTQNRLSNVQIVSKNDNWSVYGKYFKKDTILLNIANCTSIQKGDN